MVAHADDVAEQVSSAGAETNYRRLCLPCHGSTGAGDGPAAPWLWPRPRDFTKAQYKWRSTQSGAVPTQHDLERTIRWGIPSTSMHGFGDVLSTNEIAALAKRLIEYAPQKFATPPPIIELTAGPVSDSVVAQGKKLYVELGCDKCHGKDGRGKGPAATGLTNPDDSPAVVYDLRAEPFHRPRGPSDDSVEMIARSLATGLSGTPMPSFLDAASPEKLWAVAAYVDSIAARAEAQVNRSTSIAPQAAEADEVESGYWPGTPTDPSAAIWGHPIALMGEPPAQLAPAQASLSVNQCARCHAAQYRDWRQTIHGHAMSPGIVAQLIEIEHDTKIDNAKFVEGCLRCHAPLSEQQAVLRPERIAKNKHGPDYLANSAFDPGLQAEAISCAACHVREWNRHGPPKRGTQSLIPSPSYPLQSSDFYERSDFCLACHQLTPSNLLGDKPLLNTYVEWLASPYFARGIQCQHCHMPNREHTWKGIHDPQTFRQGIEVAAQATKQQGLSTVSVRVRNVGAGHYLPTTPTPAAFVDIELLDRVGRPIPGAKKSGRIGRHIRYDDQWVEVEDTRIPPGETFDLGGSWRGAGDASELLVTIRVEPDEYYERFYRDALEGELTERQRTLYRQALARAEGSHYIALTRRFPIKEKQ